MNRLLLFISPVLCLTLLFSCKKDEPVGDITRGVLINGRWVVTADTMVTGSGPQEVYSTGPDCGKDDYSIFWSSGQYFYDQGALKCDPAAIQRDETGVWTYNGTDSVLFINGGPLAGPHRVKWIDENEVYLWNETTFNGEAATRKLRMTSVN